MPGGGAGGLLPVCRSCLCADATVGLVRSEVMNGTVGLVRSYYATVGLVRSEVMRVLLASCAVALGLDCLYAVALK